ncbi:MAG: type IV secretion system protein [Rickettsiales bacterium]|nr:type IV secretion system protein [Rickettsiales bacterium]
MKKLLVITLFVLIFFSLVGCVENNPKKFGWDNTVNPPKVSSSSCDEDNSQGTILSKITYFLINPIVTQVQEVSILVFDNFVGSSEYVKAVRLALVLYVIIYGIMFVYQLVPMKFSDLMVRIVKIGVVLTLLTENSYSFFNKYLFKLFTDGSYELLSIVTNPYCDDGGSEQVNFFYFFNYIIDTLFSKYFFQLLTAMLFSYPVGWTCIVVLLTAMVKYLFAVIKAIIAYLIAFTAVALLIALAPLFIVLILFDNTRELFDNWMKALVMFALQPVVLFAGILFITIFINEIVQEVFTTIQWSKVLQIYINFGSGMKFTIFAFYWYTLSVSLSFFASLIVLYLCVDLLGKLPRYVEAIMFKLIGGQGIGVLDTAGAMMGGAGEKMKGLVGLDKESKKRRET